MQPSATIRTLSSDCCHPSASDTEVQKVWLHPKDRATGMPCTFSKSAVEQIPCKLVSITSFLRDAHTHTHLFAGCYSTLPQSLTSQQQAPTCSCSASLQLRLPLPTCHQQSTSWTVTWWPTSASCLTVPGVRTTGLFFILLPQERSVRDRWMLQWCKLSWAST